ncbi:MAG: efflux transporter outer membrane subunit [Planctomycetes bacterium]|nr:efflux transporter outer membrane subunit [Planctomycetota bacterium]
MTLHRGMAVRRGMARSALLIAVGGCAVGPDYAPPERELRSEWGTPLGDRLSQQATEADLAIWWESLGDAQLSALVERAFEQNLDLQTAASRVREARFLHAVATGSLGPDIDAAGSFNRSRRSSNSFQGFIAGDRDLWSLGFDATWEIDVFGRVRRGAEAADAQLGASIESARDALVSLVAEIARNYVELRGAQRRIQIAGQNVEAWSNTLALTESRFRAGLTTELDVAQARVDLASARARIPPLVVTRTGIESRLAVLLGAEPGQLFELAPALAEDAPVPVPPATVAIGMPADLLRRRPDIRLAERDAAAACARVGVEEAELYPQFTLSGSLGVESENFDNLIDSDSRRYAFGPDFRWNLFASGRIRNAVHAAEERHLQALLAWQSTVLTALEETRNAVAAFVQQQAERSAIVEGERAARQAVELARTLYVQGVSDFQSVLQAQRSLFALQDQLALSETALTTDLIALYKALGGGWSAAAGDPESAPAGG